MCSGNFDTDGYIRIKISDNDSSDIGSESLICFVGLNNEAVRGSIDKFKHFGDMFN